MAENNYARGVESENGSGGEVYPLGRALSRALRKQPLTGCDKPPLRVISAMAKKYLGLDKYPYHQPGEGRVVVFLGPEHTTQMGR